MTSWITNRLAFYRVHKYPKVLAKMLDKISKNLDIERILRLSYGEFEVNDIRLKCNLGQTNPSYVKRDFFLPYITRKKRRMFAI